MRLAAIDIGTNSTRLLVADLAAGKLREVARDLRTTRLGAGMDAGVLLPEAMERTAAAVAAFRAQADALGATQISAVATSCVRDAANQSEFLELVQQRAALAVQVISGDAEARLSCRGVFAGLPLEPATSIVLDVGGGSTELIWQEAGQIQTASVQAGAVRFVVNQWTEDQVEAQLAPVLTRLKALARPHLAGVGGTVTTLAAMEQQLTQYDPRLIHGYTLTAEAVERLFRQLKSLPLAARKKLPGLQPARADIIIGGTAIVHTVFKQLGVKNLTVSESDLLQGMLLE